MFGPEEVWFDYGPETSVNFTYVVYCDQDIDGDHVWHIAEAWEGDPQTGTQITADHPEYGSWTRGHVGPRGQVAARPQGLETQITARSVDGSDSVFAQQPAPAPVAPRIQTHSAAASAAAQSQLAK